MAISADDADDARRFAEERGIAYHLLHDPDVLVADAYGVAMEGGEIAIPAVFVIAQDGTIAWRKVGETMSDRPTFELILEQVDRVRGAAATSE